MRRACLLYHMLCWRCGRSYRSVMCIVRVSPQVDFDKTKHLSNRSIKKRRLEREKLEELEREREEKVRKEREEEERKMEEERYFYSCCFYIGRIDPVDPADLRNGT